MTCKMATPRELLLSQLDRLSLDHKTILLEERHSLAALTRAAVSRCPSLRYVEGAVTDWLNGRLQDTSLPLRRSAVAVMALSMDDVWQYSGIPTREAAAHSQRRLAETLRLDEGLPNFARDAAVACGGALLFGALIVVIPEPARLRDFPARARRATMSFYRRVRTQGLFRAIAWLRATRLAPWAELHLDTRNLSDFSREGYFQSYRQIAHCLEHRKYLAGAFSASWLNDPKLALISPNLEFVASTGSESGAELIQLRTDADQYAFASARSSRRRALIESGAYQPSCFGLYWTRNALLNWSVATS